MGGGIKHSIIQWLVLDGWWVLGRSTTEEEKSKYLYLHNIQQKFAINTSFILQNQCIHYSDKTDKKFYFKS